MMHSYYQIIEIAFLIVWCMIEMSMSVFVTYCSFCFDRGQEEGLRQHPYGAVCVEMSQPEDTDDQRPLPSYRVSLSTLQHQI